jgi:uncharacterized protein
MSCDCQRNPGMFLKVTHSCNLNCKYCYDRQVYGSGINTTMDINIAKKIACLALEKYDKMEFLFHGGEPLIVGKDWYNEFIDYCKSFEKPVKFNMQSNGTLINKDNLEFLTKNNIGIGISFDGLSNYKYRGANKDVENKIRLYQLRANRNVGVIAVASNDFLENIIDEYNYMKSLKVSDLSINYIKFSTDRTYLDLYVNKLLQLFEYWLDDAEPLNIRECQMMLNFYNHKKDGCSYKECHHGWIGFDYDGLVGMCDFGCYPRDLSFGYVQDYDSLDDILGNPKRLELVNQADQRYMNCVKDDCIVKDSCNGGCNAEVYNYSGNLLGNELPTCHVFKKLAVLSKKIIISKKDIKNPIVKQNL